MPGSYTPDRGDIIYTNFDPAAGREQAHNRPALVITIQAFNRHCNLALVAPITTKPKGSGFEVSLNTSNTTGAILCHQIKMIDYQERGVSFIEKAPHDVFSQALAKVRAIVG